MYNALSSYAMMFTNGSQHRSTEGNTAKSAQNTRANWIKSLIFDNISSLAFCGFQNILLRHYFATGILIASFQSSEVARLFSFKYTESIRILTLGTEYLGKWKVESYGDVLKNQPP